MVKRLTLSLLPLSLVCGLKAQATLSCRQVFSGSSTTQLVFEPGQSLQRSTQALMGGRPEEALQWTLTHLRLEPHNLGNLHVMASSLRALHREPEATLVYERILQLDPVSLFSLNPLIFLYGQQKNWSAQQRVLELALEAQGDRPELLTALISSYIRTQNFTKAESLLPRLEGIPGQNAYALSSRLHLNFAQGRFAEVVALAERARLQDPESLQVGALTLTAKAHLQLGQIQQAMESYREALVREPNNAIAITQLAHLHLLRAEHALAMPLLQRAIEVEPYNQMAFWNWTITALALKNQRLIDRRLTIETVSQRRLLLQMAQDLLRNQNEAALNQLNQLVASPGHFRPHSLLHLRAEIQHQLGRRDQAYRTLMQIVSESKRVDYQALAALIRIERHEQSISQFTPSPALQIIFSRLSPGEIELVLRIARGNLWNLLYQPPETGDSPAIYNSFWQALHSNPVDGNAVRTLRGF